MIFKREREMRLKKALFVGFVISLVTLLLRDPSFSQVKTGEAISFPGVIESIHENFKFIVVNEVRIFIFPNTKITDEKGDILKINHLKPKMNVTIEALRNPNGFFAKKIVVKTSNNKP